ncbi:MAG: RagB/SusD family nutrient uptake outer membrane protein [Prolixibacteraceae bacterium]|nr:RagB/SusD family nutrient uptake outer membrane protein [Prolixibacteraceae bacterium]
MKSIKYIIILPLLACLLYSCDESFLDTVSTDTYNEGNWWQSESQINSTLNGVYRTLNHTQFNRYALGLDAVTPSVTGPSYTSPLDVGAHDAGNFAWALSRWQACYQGIGRANYFLDNVDEIEADILSSSLKERFKAEAYFLRAFFYSQLVWFYGGVPLILEAPSFDSQSNMPRDTKDNVIAQILTDLNNAASVLPLSYSGKELGRATKGAALALKARVLLYESRWEEAAAAAKAVMDLNQYSLFPDYRDLFMLENQNNQEVVFDIQFSDPDINHDFDDLMDVKISLSPTEKFIRSYLMIDGLTTEESPLYDPENPYENRDPRMHKTCIIGGYQWKGEIAKFQKYFYTGYGFKKWTVYEDDIAKPTVLLNRSELNYIVIRYADVLLMYAEAKNEDAGPDPSVYSALNKIRDRADMPDIPEGLNKEQMRNVIRHERDIELVCEGHYYQDIRRWGIAHEVMNDVVLNYKGEVIQTRFFNPARDYLWPIHEILIQENPALEQNSEY